MRRILSSALAAAGVALLIAVMMPATASALVTSYPLLASTTCFGQIASSGDPTDMPNGNFVAIGAFGKHISTDVAPFSQTSDQVCTGVGVHRVCNPATVTMDLGFVIDGSCTDLNLGGQAGTGGAQTPCGQTTYAQGTYVINSGTYITPKGPELITATFEDSALGQLSPPGEPAPTGSDPFTGCTGTFEVYPFTAGSASNMVFTGLSGTCNMTGSQITMVCENH